MKLEGILREADLLTFRGLAALFRHGLLARGDQRSRDFVESADIRLESEKYAHPVPGILTDAAGFLDGLNENDQFERVCDLIALASDDGGKSSWIGRDIAKTLVESIESDQVARFSFDPCIHPCLLQARRVRDFNLSAYKMLDCPVRYSGIGADVRLVALAARFLGLDVYADSSPPWDPSIPDDGGEPVIDEPGIEVSFPPNEVALADLKHLEQSILAARVPQAIARGRVDVESVMLKYLAWTPASTRVVVSEKALFGRKKARLAVRFEMIDTERITQITELPSALVSGWPEGRFLIDLGSDKPPLEPIEEEPVESVKSFIMRRSNTLPTWLKRPTDVRKVREVRGKAQRVTFDDVRVANGSLAPVRYLASGPLRGRTITEAFSRMRNPEGVRLADLFDVIRPKTTRDERWGEYGVREVTPSDLSEFGEITGASRRISVRHGVYVGLEEQRLKADDILFTLKGRVGRVGYVFGTKEAEDQDHDRWASQSLMIIRARSRTTADTGRPFCNPRFLFMFLLTPGMRDHWRTVATDRRSPTVPIEELERLALPEVLYDATAIKDAGKPRTRAEATIQAQFETWQDSIARIRALERKVAEGLSQVWETTS